MKRPDSYHHGNLRQALLEAARELVTEAGVEKLTLREVARRAGVTTGAPYHHFADKAELVYALARQSLEELDHASEAALEGVHEPREQLRAIGVAYVLYAVDHPAEFRLMFRPEMGAPFDFTDPQTAPVFRILIRVVAMCRAAAGAEGNDGLDAAAISAWSLVHGLAALLVDGPLYRLQPDRERVHAHGITRKLTHDNYKCRLAHMSRCYSWLVQRNTHADCERGRSRRGWRDHALPLAKCSEQQLGSGRLSGHGQFPVQSTHRRQADAGFARRCGHAAGYRLSRCQEGSHQDGSPSREPGRA